VKLTGKGVRRSIGRKPVTLQVKPGRYTVRAAPRAKGGTRYFPIKKKRTVQVRAGHTKKVVVDYGIHVPKRTTVVKPKNVSEVRQTGATTVVRVASAKSAPKVGEILTVGVGRNSPDGVLGKVSSVSGRDVVLQSATLFDALPQGAFAAKVRMDAGSLPRTALKKGWSFDQRSGSLVNNLAKRVECGGAVNLDVSGQISLDPVFDFKADWGFLHLNSLEFSGGIQESASLSASLSAAANCGLSRTPIFAEPLRLRPVTVQVGPVPVVLVPEIQIYLEANARGQAKVEVGVSQQLRITAGLRYSRGRGLSPISHVANVLNREGPGVTATASATASVSPEFSLLIYGVAGPYLNLTGGLDFRADVNAAPWWTLDAYLNAGAGLKIPVLDIDQSKGDLIGKRWRLAQADGPFLGEPDNDGDGYTLSQDCDDNDATIHPGAPDVPNDGIDQDCDGRDAVLNGGDVQATLTWDSPADLDLHMLDTAGDEIWYLWPGPSAGGGQLDRDANPACTEQAPLPTENIYWSTGKAPQGRYRVWVELYDPCRTTDLDWHLVVRVDGRVVIDERGSGTSEEFSFFKQGE